MPTTTPVNLWSTNEHASDYLGRADSVPHRTEGERTLLEFIPGNVRRVLDLGTGSGRLLGLVKQALSKAAAGARVEAVAIDFYQGDIHLGIYVNNLGLQLLACREHCDQGLLTSRDVGIGDNYSRFSNEKSAALSVWPL